MDTKKLRQKILDLAIHGKLVPQDPNDEPASVLLERIRAEKAMLIKEGKIKAPKKSKSAGDTSHYPKQMPFDVPEGWAWCKITDVVDKLTDGTHNSPKSYPSGAYMYVTAKNIKRDGLDISNITYVTEEIHREIYSRCNPEKGDILYIKDGATCGISTINNLDKEFSLLSSVALIKPNKSILNTYLNLFLQSEFCYRNVRDSMKGVGITRIILKQMELWDIPLPPYSEQKRIVAAAEQLLQMTDAVEVEQLALEKEIKKTKKRVLDLAIHGKLVPQDPREEPAIELLKRINPSFQPSHNLHYGAELPEGWQLCHIQDIASVELGKTLDRLKNTGEEKSYLCALNVKWEAFDLSIIKTIRIEASEKERYAVRPGDLLVCEGGDVGRSAIWTEQCEMYYQNALHRIRFKTQDICQEFFLYVLRYYKVRGIIDDVCKGVTIKHFTGQVLRSLDLPFPPVKEQARIVKMVKAYYNVLDEIVAGLN